MTNNPATVATGGTGCSPISGEVDQKLLAACRFSGLHHIYARAACKEFLEDGEKTRLSPRRDLLFLKAGYDSAADAEMPPALLGSSPGKCGAGSYNEAAV